MISKPGEKVLEVKWVFSIKRGADGNIIRYKARWVEKGFLQNEAIDYSEIRSGVVKSMIWKSLLAFTVKHMTMRATTVTLSWRPYSRNAFW